MKRKFRVPGQTFSDSIGALISFVEVNPMVRASELAPKFLGISIAAPLIRYSDAHPITIAVWRLAIAEGIILLLLVRNGDIIELDVPNRRIQLHVSDAELATVPLTRHDWHGEWNYTITGPRTRTTAA